MGIDENRDQVGLDPQPGSWAVQSPLPSQGPAPQRPDSLPNSGSRSADGPAPAGQGGGAAKLSVGHFLKWLLAAAAVYPAILGVELLLIFLVLSVLVPAGVLAVFTAPSAALSAAASDDASLAVFLVVEAACLLVALPWWRHVGKRGIGLTRPAAHPSARDRRRERAGRICAVVLLGLSLQFIVSLVMSLALPLFPEVAADYEEMIEEAGIDELSLVSLLLVVVVGPILEETLFRGIVFQFALRAVSPAWSKDLGFWGFAGIRPSTAQFWVANLIQAALFGLAHGNIVQGLYAFALGLVLGWVFWRTGRLSWSVGLHMCFNLSTYLVDFLMDEVVIAGLLVLALVSLAMLAGGLLLMRRHTERSALPRAAG